MKRIIISTLVVLISLWAILPVTANAATTSSKKDGEIFGCTICTFKKYTALFEKSRSKSSTLSIVGEAEMKVLAAKDNRFQIKINQRNYWINTSEVLINLKEYIPSIDVNLDMSKDINEFNMSGNKIPGLTDRRFYNSNVAWLKYESAKKLMKAQENFLKDGYSIVIYDAYRPYDVTQEIASAFKKYLNTQTYSYKKEWFGQLGESWFLAQKVSSHNYGVAVDMTLKNIKTGEELSMPSKMHTLDKRAAYYYWSESEEISSKNAIYLKSVMESAGFSYLKSEWWHFQDDTISWGEKINIFF